MHEVHHGFAVDIDLSPAKRLPVGPGRVHARISPGPVPYPLRAFVGLLESTWSVDCGIKILEPHGVSRVR